MFCSLNIFLNERKSFMDENNITVIMKSTNDCNLACVYCYNKQAKRSGIMSDEVLETSIKNILLSYKPEARKTFIWHGGEPMLAGIEFFEKVKIFTDKHKRKGERFRHSIQTNGTLLNEEKIDWLISNQFDIGLSIDGTATQQNITRPYKSGKGSFDDVFNTIKILRTKQNHAGAILILTQKNVKDIKEAIQFFHENKVHIKINLLINNPCWYDKSLYLSNQEYLSYLKEIFDYWFLQGFTEYIQLDNFMDKVEALLSGRASACSYNDTCQKSFISIGPQGDIYPCGRFDGCEDMILGNILTDDFQTILTSPKRKQLQNRDLAIQEQCSDCNYYHICKGGCLHEAYVSGNINSKDPGCYVIKGMYAHIEKTLKDEATKCYKRRINNEQKLAA
jgi:uncharacterized protein